SISKPVIRGLHSQRILLLNDGVQQEGQQWGGEHAPEIDPFSISKIEVLKGAAGVEHGSGAIGGVVSVKPAELPTEQSLSGKILLDAFSNNRQASGSLMLQGYNGFGWRFQGSLRKAGSSKTPDFVIANSGFEEKNYSLTLGYQKFETHFSHFGTELGIYKGSHIGNVSDLQKAIETGKPLVDYDFSYEILPPKQKISHNLFTLKTQQKLWYGKIETQYGFQKNHRQEFDAHKPYSDSLEVLNKPSFELTLTTHTLETKFAHKPAKNFWGTLGVSGMRQGNIRNGAVVIIPNFRSYNGGIFGVENFSKDKLTANLGLRYDFRWVKVFPLSFKNIAEKIYTCKNFTAALGTAYDFTENLSVLVNFGTAWRPPSLNELYSNDVHHGAAQFEIGDLNLKNERSFNSDLTFRYKTEKNNFEISFYNNLMKNFIFLFPDSIPTLTVRGAFPTFRYKQAEAVLRGFDGTFTTKLTDFYELSANFSTVFGTNTDTNEPLFLMPSDRLKLANTFSLPNFYNLTNSYFEFSGNFVRKQTRFPKNVDYTEPPKGYTLFDFGGGTELNFASQKIEVSFSVKNIFDTSYRDYLSRYRYFIDDAGRNIVLKVQIPFGKN
ncbi:TonB-dependent receptor, partial [bacterium]|nr:TonB-dependent receptor [bacterium]